MILNTKPDGVISIHALREEGDATVPARDAPPRISIHALREEGDKCSQSRRDGTKKFLSTPSARRATRLLGPVAPGRTKFLSTPSARRATC